MRKPVFGVSVQVQNKPGCTATENGKKLEILDLESRRIVLCSEKKGADQLCNYCTADLHLCFCICKKQVFSWRGSNIPLPFQHVLLVAFEIKWASVDI